MKSCTLKLLYLLVLIVFVQPVFAETNYSGHLVESEEFEQTAEVPMTKMIPWASSFTVCHATTVCPNGVPIFCRVYGSQAVGGFGAYANACRWLVFPGQGVRCQGYVQQMGPMGYFWTWVDFPVSCF